MICVNCFMVDVRCLRFVGLFVVVSCLVFKVCAVCCCVLVVAVCYCLLCVCCRCRLLLFAGSCVLFVVRCLMSAVCCFFVR